LSRALEITLIAVLVALTVGLLPLLYQLRRTARGLDLFLLAAKRDLAQIAEDVHASHVRMDHLAATVQASMVEFSSFAKSINDVGTTLTDLHTRFRTSIESTTQNLGAIIGGVSTVLAFFKNKPTQQEPE
jgi:hypothetical protein